jgi:hypothetical protein
MKTKFEQVYNCFYSKITDDMYMELDEAQTKALSEELLLNALPWFEFPRKNIHNYDLTKKCFNVQLDYEEVNIIATYMMIGWFDQQLASVEVVRMKFSGSDFKFTSQANHMSKLLALKKDYERVGFHLQRLYKRRKADSNGVMVSTFGSIMASSVRGGIQKTTAGNPTPSNNGSVPSITPDNNSSSSEDKTWEDMGNIESNTPNNGSGDNDSWDNMEDISDSNTSGSDTGNWDDLT